MPAKQKSKRKEASRPHAPKMAAPGFNESFVLEKSESRPKLKNPLLVAGLPGIGFVSKLAVDHLIQELGAKKTATLYSPYFPNQVLALKNGKLRPFTLKFYFAKTKNRDMIFLKGDLQPLTIEGQYEVSAKALAYAASLGAKEVVAMAGYAINKQTPSPIIYCASTNKEQFLRLSKLGAKKNTQAVPIVGLAGMMPALSKIYGAKGACLLVETPGNIIDAKGAKALVEFLGKLVGQKFDTKKLESNAKKAEELIKNIEQQAQAEALKASEASAAPEATKHETLSYIR